MKHPLDLIPISAILAMMVLLVFELNKSAAEPEITIEPTTTVIQTTSTTALLTTTTLPPETTTTSTTAALTTTTAVPTTIVAPTTTAAPAAGALAEQDQIWIDAYLAGGGQNLETFLNVILPCESGGDPNPHGAISRTNDFGRGQVNRAVWRLTVEQRYGLPFEQAMTTPALNGDMSAYIEQVQRAHCLDLLQVTNFPCR